MGGTPSSVQHRVRLDFIHWVQITSDSFNENNSTINCPHIFPLELTKSKGFTNLSTPLHKSQAAVTNDKEDNNNSHISSHLTDLFMSSPAFLNRKWM